MSTNLGNTLFNTNCDRVWYGTYIGWWTFLPPCPNDTGPSEVVEESSRELRLRAEGWKYVSHHAGRAPIVMSARVGRIWGVFNPRQTRGFDEIGGRGKYPLWFGFVLFYPMLVLSVVGLVRLRRRRISIVPFVAMAAVVTITAAAFYGAPRFRVPADVAMIVLTAIAIDSFVGTRRGAERAVDATLTATPAS